MADITNALPTYNIANINSDIGFYKTLFRLHDVKKMFCLPAIVEKYDRKTHIAGVRPLVKASMRTENGEELFDRPLYSVPVYQISHGGFLIDAPLFVGDTGMLFAVDREWTEARKKNRAVLTEPQDPKNGEDNPNAGTAAPDSYGLGSFEYGIFIPCSWAETNLEDSDGLVVRLAANKDDSEAEIVKEITLSKEKVSVKVGDATYKISKDGIEFDGKPSEEIQLLTAIRYDKTTHQIQTKTLTFFKHGTFIVGVSDESEWSMIAGGQAEPLITT